MRERLLIVERFTERLVNRALPLCREKMDVRVFDRTVRGRVMSAKTYAARFNDDIDFSACAIHQAFRRNEPGRQKYLNPNSFFYKRLRRIAAEADAVLDSFRPHAIIIHHGYTPLAQIMRAKAAKYRVPALYLEPPILPGNGFILDPYAPFFAPSGANMIERHWETASPLSEKKEKAIDLFLSHWRKERRSKYQTREDDSETRRLDAFLDKNNAPAALFVLQMPRDMNVALSLPPSFHGNYERWVEEVIQAVPPDWKLIIKPHPRSDYSPPADGDNKITIHNVNLHDALKRADCVIVLSSNAGLEAIMTGKPVIAPPACYYTRKGLTLDLTAPRDLPALLNRARAFQPPDEMRRRFLHHVLLDYYLHPGENDKFRKRLALARPPEDNPPLFSLLPENYRAYKTIIDNYGKTGARDPGFAMRDEWTPNPIEIFLRYWQRLFVRHRRRWLRRIQTLERVLKKYK